MTTKRGGEQLFSLEVGLIALLSLVEGLSVVTKLAQAFFLKEALHLSPSDTALFASILEIPWMIKPLLFFYFQSVPLWNYHTKSYLFLFSLLGLVGWGLVASPLVFFTGEASMWPKMIAGFAFLLCTFESAVSDLMMDQLVIDRIKTHSVRFVNFLQTLFAAASMIGNMASSYFSSYLLGHFSSQQLFLLTCVLPLISMILAWSLQEQQSRQTLKLSSLSSKYRAVYLKMKHTIQGFSERSVFVPSVMVMLLMLLPTMDSAMFYFLTEERGLSHEGIGDIQFTTQLFSFCGLWLFNYIALKLDMHHLIPFVLVLASSLYLPTGLLIQGSGAFTPVDGQTMILLENITRKNAVNFVYRMNLVLCTQICGDSNETGFYTMLMAVMNIGEGLHNLINSGLLHVLNITDVQFSNLWMFNLMVMASHAIPLIYFWIFRGYFRPRSVDQKQE